MVGATPFLALFMGKKRGVIPSNPVRTVKYNEFPRLNFDTCREVFCHPK